MPTLVLLRHGQSMWNADGRFAGWVDVALTAEGECQAVKAAHLLAAHRLLPRLTHTSVLSRARKTAEILLSAVDIPATTLQSDWRLNERHYGALQGMSKSVAREVYGEAQFRAWRRSYDAAPPPIVRGSEWDVPRDRPYFGLPANRIPRAESLADATRRFLPYWNDVVVPQLRTGAPILIVAHSNILRAIVAHLDGLHGEDLVNLNIPTGQPMLYDLDPDMVPVVAGGRYLDADAAAIGSAAVAVEGQPGATQSPARTVQ